VLAGALVAAACVADADSGVGRRGAAATATAQPEAGLVGPVVRVGNDRCGAAKFGSAVLVSGADGPVIVSNRHVVRGAASVSSPAGRLDVVGLVPDRDLAVIAAPADVSGVVEVGAPAAVGDRVQVVGFPDGERDAAWGSVVSIEQRLFGPSGVDVLVVDVEVHPGSSGGAVLDAAGELVGVVAARDPRTGWAVAHPAADITRTAVPGVEPCTAPAGAAKPGN
jgi:S1-C subfamily serine protease